MKVLLVGVGGVGEAIAAMAKPRKWMDLMVLAEYNTGRAEEVRAPRLHVGAVAPRALGAGRRVQLQRPVVEPSP